VTERDTLMSLEDRGQTRHLDRILCGHLSTHAEKLVHEGLDGVEIERASLAMRVHVLLQVLITELEREDVSDQNLLWEEEDRTLWIRSRDETCGTNLEDENELRLGMDHVPQSHDVRMLELCQTEQD
jgi:hypothetical protein